MKSLSPRFLIILLLIVFGIIYCLISPVNHYFFRTYAFDLGLFNHALYDYAHFRLNDYSILRNNYTNPLGDHFSLISMVAAPLYWIFGTYTLLLFQILAILLGATGVFFYLKNKTDHPYLPVLAVVHFLCMWGIFSALSFDYHDNVVAAMLLPWFLYFFDRRKLVYASCMFILILISKENMALWAIFISLGLALIERKEKKSMLISLGFASFALVYFIVVVKLVMPQFAIPGSSDGYYHFKYHALGQTGWEAIQTVLTKPIYTFKLLFANHNEDPQFDGIKQELHMMVLLAGGWALLFRPSLLVMLIPIYAQKLFSDDVGKWGINYHYSIEFVPVVTLALFMFLSEVKNRKRMMQLSLCMVALNIYATASALDSRKSVYYDGTHSRFYQKSHYENSLAVKEVHQLINSIPEDASVSASSPFVPHLAFRRDIYQFPDVSDASYILIFSDISYPLTPEELNKKIEELKHNPEWEKTFDSSNVFLFRKKI